MSVVAAGQGGQSDKNLSVMMIYHRSSSIISGCVFTCEYNEKTVQVSDTDICETETPTVSIGIQAGVLCGKYNSQLQPTDDSVVKDG